MHINLKMLMKDIEVLNDFNQTKGEVIQGFHIVKKIKKPEVI